MDYREFDVQIWKDGGWVTVQIGIVSFARADELARLYREKGSHSRVVHWEEDGDNWMSPVADKVYRHEEHADNWMPPVADKVLSILLLLAILVMLADLFIFP